MAFALESSAGETVHNQITDLFEKPRLIVIRGSDSPFVFIWDQDVAGCILHAISTDKTGIHNVAGDGALTIKEIASRLGKPCVVLPAWMISGAEASGSFRQIRGGHCQGAGPPVKIDRGS